MRTCLFTIVVICIIKQSTSFGQILHSESFTVILDSTKNIQGAIYPDFKFQNLRKDLFQFENIADFTIKAGKNAITLSNKIDLAKFGSETLLSGGYLYMEYRNIMDKKLSLEYFGQAHWAEARGLDRKYAFGINCRWRLVKQSNLGVFIGIGPFYEFERWNYNGVSDPPPVGDKSIETEIVKLGSYVSIKYSPFQKIFLDISVYYQSAFDELISSPRLASSTRATYQFSKHLGLSLLYQNIYDPEPTVPIDELFNNISAGLSISF